MNKEIINLNNKMVKIYILFYLFLQSLMIYNFIKNKLMTQKEHKTA